MFTAGPWERQEYDKDVGGVPIIAANLSGLVGAALAWPTEIDTAGSERVTANANLIAAAPTMHEALADIARQKLSGEMDDDQADDADWQGGYDRLIEIARKALEPLT